MFLAEDGWGIILWDPISAAFSRQGFARSLAPASKGHLCRAAGLGLGTRDLAWMATGKPHGERRFPQGVSPSLLGFPQQCRAAACLGMWSGHRSLTLRGVLIPPTPPFVNRDTAVPSRGLALCPPISTGHQTQASHGPFLEVLGTFSDSRLQGHLGFAAPLKN